jgi:hypothetical protein
MFLKTRRVICALLVFLGTIKLLHMCLCLCKCFRRVRVKDLKVITMKELKTWDLYHFCCIIFLCAMDIL